MELVNGQVEHILFGIGRIVCLEEEVLYVEFSKNKEIKRFVYPDAFDKYLKICDSKLKAIILTDLKIKNAQIEADRIKMQQKQEEEAKRIAMEIMAQKPKKKRGTKNN